MSQWQPIETAPKDGTLNLVTGLHGAARWYYLARWQRRYSEMARGETEAWWSSGGVVEGHSIYGPSGGMRLTPDGWMPLPEGPA